MTGSARQLGRRGGSPGAPTPVRSLSLQRIGGPEQELPCMDFVGGLVAERDAPHVLTLLERNRMATVVPLGFSDQTVLKLKPGRSLRRSVTLSGACDAVVVTNGPASAANLHAFSDSCRVQGRIYLQLTRAR